MSIHVRYNVFKTIYASIRDTISPLMSLCEKIFSDLCRVNELYIRHANESTNPRQLNTAISIFRHDFNILCSCTNK